LRAGPALRFATIVSSIVVVLMAIESALGLVVADLYPEAPWAIASLRGNDLVTLVLVAPMLGVAVARQRSDRWALVWLSGLLYGVYNFAYYAFGTAFNDVFLLHVASLSLSVLGLIALASSLDATSLSARAGTISARRPIAAFMVFVGTALTVAWSGFSLRFAINGQLPEDVMPPTAVHLVYALDLSLLAPMFLAGGILLWRRAAWGYVLGVAVNLFGAAYLVVLEFVGGFQANDHIGTATWLSPPAIVGASLCALSAVVLLRHLPSPSTGTDRS
jgi:hypothetical protein